MTDTPRPTLASTGAVYVTLAAARRFRELGGYGEHELETARRELTELLLDAKQSTADPSRWRARRRATDLDLTAIVAREGRLLVVTSVNARAYDPSTTTGSRRRVP
jgi:hypothetical protein